MAEPQQTRPKKTVPANVKIPIMIEEYTSYLSLNKGYSKETCNEYRKDLKLFVKWLQQHSDCRRWGKVSKDDIDSWVADMSQNGLQPPTIKRRVAALRGLYQYAWIKGLTTENPAKYVSTPKAGEKTVRTVSTEAISAAINDETTERWVRLAIAMISETGMRVSEARNVQKEDIDTAAHTIRVRGKGNKERIVMYGQQTEEQLSSSTTIKGRLFHQEDYEYRRAIWEAMRKHTTEKRCSAHILRHTFATTMLNNGAPLESIKELLGHTSVKTTERYAKMTLNKTREDYKQYKPHYTSSTAKQTTTA